MGGVDKSPSLSRREARRLERREAIVSVAAGYFLEHGYAGTTMSGIAATLGGSKGTLWSHFPSKEALFAAVLDSRTLAFRERLAQVLDIKGDFRETLRQFCRSHLAKVTSDEAVALHRLVVAEAQRFPEVGRIFFEGAPVVTWSMLARFLDAAMEHGLLRRADPMVAARLLAMMNISGCHQQQLWGQIDKVTPEQIEADVDAALDFFFRAYAPESA